MAKIDKLVAAMRNSAKNVAYDDLQYVCVRYFGRPRRSGSSHAVFRTPWVGDPRVNIQRGKDGKAKPYQVRQVLKAIERLEQGEK